MYYKALTNQITNNINPDKTRLKAHAADSMQPHSKFPEDTLVTTLIVCVMYLWHFLSAATQQRGEEEVKK